jgi:hypothetical protein
MDEVKLDLLHTKLRNLKTLSQDIQQCKLALNDLNALTELKGSIKKLIESETDDLVLKVSKLLEDTKSTFKLIDRLTFPCFQSYQA